jgi:hypothetical protein
VRGIARKLLEFGDCRIAAGKVDDRNLIEWDGLVSGAGLGQIRVVIDDVAIAGAVKRDKAALAGSVGENESGALGPSQRDGKTRHQKGNERNMSKH